jgi:hypothetical protein
MRLFKHAYFSCAFIEFGAKLSILTGEDWIVTIDLCLGPLYLSVGVCSCE